MATKIELNLDYDKLKLSMRYWLIGKEYWTALKAFEFGLTQHTGTRKDGVTPEFAHQIFQMQYARTLVSSFMYPEETLAVIALHDTVEDCEGVNSEYIWEEYGDEIGSAVDLMTNRYPNGQKKLPAEYYESMAIDPLASIAKGVDRMHNQQSMQSVFSREKQLSYIEETRDFILPMMVEARKRFPQQEPVYHNVKIVLLTQMEFVQYLHAGVEDGKN